MHLDPEGRPIASTGRVSAVEEGGLLYSDESQLYKLSAAWYPTPALGVRANYVKFTQDEFGDAHGMGLTAGWGFFRRNFSATISFSRTRQDGVLDPRFGTRTPLQSVC